MVRDPSVGRCPTWRRARRVTLVEGDLLDPAGAAPTRSPTARPTSSTTWPRRRSCPPRGRTRATTLERDRRRDRGRCWAPRGARTPAMRVLVATLERGLRRRGRVAAARGARRCARARPTASRSSPPTGSSARCATATACSPVGRDHLQPRVAAPAGALPAAQGRRAARRRSRSALRGRARARRPRRGARLVARRRRRARRAGSRCRPTSRATTSSPRGVGRTVGELVDGRVRRAPACDAEGRVRVDPAFVRPPEATPPVGDPSHARAGARLGARDRLRGDDRRDGRRPTSAAAARASGGATA